MGDLKGIAFFMLVGVWAMGGVLLGGVTLLLGLIIAIPAWVPWTIVAACVAIGAVIGLIVEVRG